MTIIFIVLALNWRGHRIRRQQLLRKKNGYRKKQKAGKAEKRKGRKPDGQKAEMAENRKDRRYHLEGDEEEWTG